MNVEEQTAASREQLARAEEEMLHALATARHVITLQEEELRLARLEAAKRDDDVLTEEQFAKIFKVARVTITKLRKKGTLEPIWIGSLPRYLRSIHVAGAAEIFAAKSKGQRAKR